MAKLAATSSFALLRIKASFKALFIDAIQIHKSVVAIFILLSSGYYGGFLLDQMLFGGLHAIIYESNLKKKNHHDIKWENQIRQRRMPERV